MLTGLEERDAIVDFLLALGPRIVALKLGREGANAGAATGTLPCLESAKRPLPATCPSCPVCPAVLPADRAIFELFVEPRF